MELLVDTFKDTVDIELEFTAEATGSRENLQSVTIDLFYDQ